MLLPQTLDTAAVPPLAIGGWVRIAPNHSCMTGAAHDRCHVIDGGDEVVAVWERVIEPG